MERETFTRLEQLPNVGPAIAAKLRLIDVRSPSNLIGRDPYLLFEELSARTAQRHDPCLLDVVHLGRPFHGGRTPEAMVGLHGGT